MQLLSLKCPNCNGSLKMVKEGVFYCQNCDSEFMADYDKDDVEYQKMKTEAELRKQQLNMAESGAAERARKAKDQFKIKLIGIAVGFILLLIIVVPTVIVTLKTQREAQEAYLQQQREREERQEAEAREREERLRQEEEDRLAAEEAERQAILESYRLTPEEITADTFFTENASKTFRVQLWDNTNLFYDNWKWNEEPEYITSFLLTAKDENNREQNILISIYKIYWDKEYEDRTDRYVMYDGACFYNISRNEDGTIRCDYAPDSLTFNSEIVANQFLSGYTDYDQLIRQEIYGNSEYTYVEFTMPEDID